MTTLTRSESIEAPVSRPALDWAGRILFALGVLGLGIQHFVFGDFIMGRAPAWPAARIVAVSGLMVFLWIWIVHLPRTLFSVSDGITIFEAPVVEGVAWKIAFLHEAPSHH